MWVFVFWKINSLEVFKTNLQIALSTAFVVNLRSRLVWVNENENPNRSLVGTNAKDAMVE